MQRSFFPTCFHITSSFARYFSSITPTPPRRSPHRDLRDSLQQVTGAEQRNKFQGRGTIIRTEEPATLDVVLEKVDNLEKLDICRRYNLQPRDVRTGFRLHFAHSLTNICCCSWELLTRMWYATRAESHLAISLTCIQYRRVEEPRYSYDQDP